MSFPLSLPHLCLYHINDSGLYNYNLQAPGLSCVIKAGYDDVYVRFHDMPHTYPIPMQEAGLRAAGTHWSNSYHNHLQHINCLTE